MNDPLELSKDIAQLRRDQPRNPVTARVCDALERLLQSRNLPNPAMPKSLDLPTLTFDRKSYMRDYMKKKRAKGKP
jgi:hypothetical protein